ncbi:carbamoyltransferase N-terminal domain-containing protein [Streptomyces sp. NPDC048337]|uniref:carbamoyltransferase N-terminal domain-containing protein n=1 Tax=Streptomyces sp. NPDC048337 TaxID=3365535 RepID=UPI0037151AA6
MLICGVKASHDGGVCVIDENRLVFSIEMEKIGNRHRYSPLDDLSRVGEILRSEGLDPDAVDRFVVDGWWVQGNETTACVPACSGGRLVRLPVAPYLDGPKAPDPLQRYTFAAHDFGSRGSGYASYHHAANHLLGPYCSSPFAARGEDAIVLVWDGGMAPRLYQVAANTRTVRAVSSLLPLPGGAFASFCSHFDPFRPDTTGFSGDEYIQHHLSIAGKAMAYAALGVVETSAFTTFDRIMADFGDSLHNSSDLGREVATKRDQLLPGLSNADIVATFQAYLGELLLSELTALVKERFPDRLLNLALGGGCAMNIKWNSMLRSSGLFREIWIPPFPNDSGAAIGTAVCEMFREGRHLALDWNVYSGPRLTDDRLPDGWEVRACSEGQLASLLHTEGEPVVVLSGRAEIGPRALGNRSILAPATSPGMKDRLNAIKGRAKYRPVSPICLTARAADVFTPGNADRYMLFEHRMRGQWARRLPAVAHLDGTARLQTIDPSTNSASGRILAEYERVSGIPVLCNTSANENGRGFFPDVAAAARWGRTRYIWSEGVLYTNPDSARPVG